MTRITLKDWALPVTAVPAGQRNIDLHLHDALAMALGVPTGTVRDYRILQKSVDARRKGNALLVYGLEVELDSVPVSGQWSPAESLAVPVAFDAPLILTGGLPPPLHPIVVGTGPAGLCAAWVLARQGLKPLILDRGCPVEQREADLERFFQTRELNPDSNFLFGEGGAGTYSDGKLYTRIRDPRCAAVLALFVATGAPREILYLKRPHIGSDILPVMVKRLRQRIEELGGEFRWAQEVTAPLMVNGRCRGVVLKSGERIEAPAVFMGFGHSARELIGSLMAAGVSHELKGFQIGCRIEHPQRLIDRNQYGMSSLPACLGAAEYNFVSKPPIGIAGVSSFCMCPGGEVVPATAVAGHLSTNGMSRYRRDGEFANSCLITTWQPEAFNNAADAFVFIDRLESSAFVGGGGDYTAPAQDAAAFLRGEKRLEQAKGSFRLGMVPARLDRMFPEMMTNALKTALPQFDRQCRGFIAEGKLVGIETHISSPVRFSRQPEQMASSLPGLYIIGEGAGCAGGIVSAAVDGWKAADEYLQAGF